MRNKIVVFGMIGVLALMPPVFAFANEASLPSPTTYTGATLYVGGSGPGNYTAIQDAINASLDGDTVYVYRHEPFYWENVVVNKSISLIADHHDVSLQACDWQRPAIHIIRDSVKVDGFRITYEGGEIITSYAIIADGVSDVNISNCDLYTTMSTITFNNVANSSIFHNYFELIELYEAGILLSGGCDNTIRQNHFDNHFGYDLLITAGAQNTLVAHNNFSWPCDLCGATAISLSGAGAGSKIIENNFLVPARGGAPSYWHKNYYWIGWRSDIPFLHRLPTIIFPLKSGIDWRPAPQPYDYTWTW